MSPVKKVVLPVTIPDEVVMSKMFMEKEDAPGTEIGLKLKGRA